MGVRVIVSGIGIISAIGNNVAEVLDALKNSRSGIGPITSLSTVHQGHIPVGEVKKGNEQLAEFLNIPFDPFMSRTALLGLTAASEAVGSAGIDPTEKGIRTGIINATTVGGMDKTEINFRNFEKGYPYNYFIFTHDCGDSTERLADFFGLNGFITTISTACSSSANSIMMGARMIKAGLLDRVIVGGTDSLSKFTLNGFNTLMILDKQQCRPFDKNRTGLNLGEGAAYLVLEAEELTRNKKRYCEVKGYANANDAYHQTASSPNGLGPYLSMKGALESAGLRSADIDYINAHGTGTDNNDLTEGIAIGRIFSPHIPAFSSTKPLTGHTLGAAGAVEAVISSLAIQEQLIFPNLNFSEKMDELDFEPTREFLKDRKILNVLSNSFGFGGNDSTLIFSAC